MPDSTVTLRDIMSKRSSPLWEEDSINAITPILKQLMDIEGSDAVHEPVSPDTLIFNNGKLYIRPSGGAWDTQSPFTPPEVRAGQKPDGKSDVYAVCAVLKYMMTGLDPVPYDGSVPPESEFDAILKRGLSFNPNSRFESVKHFCIALNRYRSANDSLYSQEPEPEPEPEDEDEYQEKPKRYTRPRPVNYSMEDESDETIISSEYYGNGNYGSDSYGGDSNSYAPETQYSESGAEDSSQPLPKEAFSDILNMPDKPKPKSKAPIIITVSVLAAAIIAVLAVYFITYSMASSAAKSGDFEAADGYLLMKPITNALDSQLVDYIAAGVQLDNGEYAAAITSFEALSGYLDSDIYAKEARYKLAGEQADAGNYDEAIANYKILADSGYSNAKALWLDTRCDKIESEFGSTDDYESMVNELTQLVNDGSNKAVELLRDARYLLAGQQLENGDYEGATENYALLAEDSYKDSAQQLQEAQYRYASSLIDGGDYEGAMENFKALGTYGDSMNKYYDAMYLLAKQQLDSGEYGSAAESFKKLVDRGGYDDAGELLNQAKYGSANELYENGDYESALSSFEELAETNYGDAKTMCSHVRYDWAKKLIDEGDSLTAYSLLNEVDSGVIDVTADKNALAEPLYTEGEGYYDAGNYEDALEVFSVLAPYSDSQRFVELSNAHLNRGDYETLIPAIMKYLDFKDAASVVVLNQNYANIYLLGEWESSNGDYYYSQDSEGGISYNLPWKYDKSFYSIKNGIMYVFNDGEDEETFEQFRITPVSETSVKFYCYSDENEYQLEKK